jgi:threonine dehydratase
MKPIAITIEDIHAAARRIRPYAHRTPVLTCESLDRMTGAHLFMKCENFQKVGAFKFRGACNAVFSLTEEKARRGVVTHSSGNHAQALALAARLRGIRAYIVMPSNTLAVKKVAVAGYGGEITLCEPTLEARETTAQRIISQTGATLVHPYDNPLVIAGQGTATLELLEEVPILDVILVPVGGGGLLSGTAIAAKALVPSIRVMAAEPEMADDACRSLAAGRILLPVNPQTIADGLLTSLGKLTFPIIQEYVEQIVTVSEELIILAMRSVWERAKIVIEPSAAVPVGALLEKKADFSGLRIGVILSGGNVDLEQLPWMKS